MKSSERFTKNAISDLIDAINDAGGNEVFAAGKLDQNGLVCEVIIAARGDSRSVLALPGFVDRGNVIIHNHPSGVLEASQADLAVAGSAGENGIGSYIVDNEVKNVYVIAEPVRSTPLICIDSDELSSVLKKDGKLAKKLGNFEPRQSQIDLIKAICDAMNNGYPLAAEAGTGVGKSFAYLLPAFAWAARNKERVVISTATINLQNQLIEKDIPLVSSIFRKPLKAVLLKGRGNYICHSRLFEAIDEEGLFAGDEDHILRKLESWAESSKTGDKEELSFQLEPGIWNKVRSESDECLNMRCPYREKCFVLKSKREALDSDIIVANHHMLFSDISARANGAGYESTAVFPPYTTIIFDEAHAIEPSVTSLFTQEASKFSFTKQINKIYREKRGRKFGIILKLQNVCQLPKSLLKAFEPSVSKALECINVIDEASISMCDNETSIRIDQHVSEFKKLLEEELIKLEQAILELTDLLKQALDKVSERDENNQAVEEAKLALVRLSNLASFCLHFREYEDDQEHVFWIEKSKTSTGEVFATLMITPIEIKDIVSSSVFDAFRSVICVSATLTVNNSFNFFKNQVGLGRQENEEKCIVFPSPFPYKENALLVGAQDAPDPRDSGWQDWVNDKIYKLIAASGGRALVLFTSYTSLHSCWDKVKPKLDKLGITAFRQGESERTRLLESFTKDISSVLFATNSFWEGIDARGETLELVIITKLPFKVPSDPVQSSRAEAIEKRGRNPFMDMSLPETIIQFKQGFGRLIRHSEDKGAVVVLDSRLLKKQYGSMFIRSLPETMTCFRSMEEGINSVSKFIGRPINK